MQEFKFTQASPSASWTINHNLNDHPAVDVVLSDGRKILPGLMTHVNMNTLLVTFQTPQTGFARLIGTKTGPYQLIDTGDMTDRGFVSGEPEQPAADQYVAFASFVQNPSSETYRIEYQTTLRDDPTGDSVEAADDIVITMTTGIMPGDNSPVPEDAAPNEVFERGRTFTLTVPAGSSSEFAFDPEVITQAAGQTYSYPAYPSSVNTPNIGFVDNSGLNEVKTIWTQVIS